MEQNNIIKSITNIINEYKPNIYNSNEHKYNIDWVLAIIKDIFIDGKHKNIDKIEFKINMEELIRIIVSKKYNNNLYLLIELTKIYLSVDYILYHGNGIFSLIKWMKLIFYKLKQSEFRKYVRILYDWTFYNKNINFFDINLFERYLIVVKELFIDNTKNVLSSEKLVETIISHIFITLNKAVEDKYNFYKNKEEFKIVNLVLDIIDIFPVSHYFYKINLNKKMPKKKKLNKEFDNFDNSVVSEKTEYYNELFDFHDNIIAICICSFYEDFDILDKNHILNINSKNIYKRYFIILKKVLNYIFKITPDFIKYLNLDVVMDSSSSYFNLLKKTLSKFRINILEYFSNKNICENEIYLEYFIKLIITSTCLLRYFSDINDVDNEEFLNEYLNIHSLIFYDSLYENVFEINYKDYLNIISYDHLINNIKYIKMMNKYHYIHILIFILHYDFNKYWFLSKFETIIFYNIKDKNIKGLISNFVLLNNLFYTYQFFKDNIIEIASDNFFDLTLNKWPYDILTFTILDYYFKFNNFFKFEAIKKCMDLFFKLINSHEKNNFTEYIFDILFAIANNKKTNSFGKDILKKILYNSHHNEILLLINEITHKYFYDFNILGQIINVNTDKNEEMKVICDFISNNQINNNILNIIKSLSLESKINNFFNNHLDKNLFFENLLSNIKENPNIFISKFMKQFHNIIAYTINTDYFNYNFLIFINFCLNKNLLEYYIIEYLLKKFKDNYNSNILEGDLTNICKSIALTIIIYIKYIKINPKIEPIDINLNIINHPKILKDILKLLKLIKTKIYFKDLLEINKNYENLDILSNLIIVEIYYELVDVVKNQDKDIINCFLNIVDILFNINNKLNYYENYKENDNDSIDNLIKHSINRVVIDDNDFISKIFDDFKIKIQILKYINFVNYIDKDKLDFYKCLIN